MPKIYSEQSSYSSGKTILSHTVGIFVVPFLFFNSVDMYVETYY